MDPIELDLWICDVDGGPTTEVVCRAYPPPTGAHWRGAQAFLQYRATTDGRKHYGLAALRWAAAFMSHPICCEGKSRSPAARARFASRIRNRCWPDFSSATYQGALPPS